MDSSEEGTVLGIKWKNTFERISGSFRKYRESGQNTLVQELEAIEESLTIPPVALLNQDLASPIYDVEANGLALPQLVDSYSDALTMDAWDWQSAEIEAKESLSPLATLEADLVRDKRGCVVWNMFQTEQNYTALLFVIKNFFHRQLLKRSIITEQSGNLIFAGLAELHEFHVDFSAKMETTISDWDTSDTAIGALFIQHADEMSRIYTRFIDNYSISQKSIKREVKENAEFVLFMNETSNMPETNRQSLKDVLITPVQRTTRYHLLLKDLLKSTPAEHPDHKDLQLAWEKMSFLATTVNDKKRKEEEATGLFEAFETTKHCPPTLISNRRRLILNSDATCPKSNRAIRLDLCSDLLMISLVNNKRLLSSGGRSISGLQQFGQQTPDYEFRFLRWLDLLEIEIADMHAIKPHTIRITLNSTSSTSSLPSSRRSNSTQPADIPAAAKDLGALSFSVSFATTFDPIKSRTTFLEAVDKVTQTLRKTAQI